jgi:hypothetical protein
MFRAIKNALFVHHDKFEYKPNCLIADAAPAIHNGFMAALTKQENKSLINLNYVHGRYHLLKGSFDDFLKYFSKVRLIKLNKDNWLFSTCNCSWFLKNYYCYHFDSNCIKYRVDCYSYRI